MTKNITNVTLVHIILCWKGTLVSGTCTSGMRGVKGFTRSRKRTVMQMMVSWARDHTSKGRIAPDRLHMNSNNTRSISQRISMSSSRTKWLLRDSTYIHSCFRIGWSCCALLAILQLRYCRQLLEGGRREPKGREKIKRSVDLLCVLGVFAQCVNLRKRDEFRNSEGKAVHQPCHPCSLRGDGS